jgi:hypothetical protein
MRSSLSPSLSPSPSPSNNEPLCALTAASFIAAPGLLTFDTSNNSFSQFPPQLLSATPSLQQLWVCWS